MRILHTSDWHVGRTFHGVDLLADQEAVLAAIAAVVAERRVDAVVVAGDVYDRAVPSADAVAVAQRSLVAIREAGAQLVVSSGNHDSATRLGAGAAFTAAGGLNLRTSVASLDVPVVLHDAHGPLYVYAIPYLEPEVTRLALEVPKARSHAEVLTAAMDRIRADLAVRGGGRAVVAAHAFVVGAQPSESERSISVGGVETVPAEVFAGVDYVALGHLHSPQAVTESVRYSGSPLPYSFGERSRHKGVFIAEFDAAGLASVEEVALPVVRGLAEIEGPLPELLVDPALHHAEAAYVRAVLTDEVRPLDAMRQLQTRFPFAVHLEWRPPQREARGTYSERVRGRSDVEIAHGFLADVRSAPNEAERVLLEQAFASVASADPARSEASA